MLKKISFLVVVFLMCMLMATISFAGGGPSIPISKLPHTISESGSYYITSNLTCTSGTIITIDADDVTLDLKGFTIIGGGISANYGIYVDGEQRNIEIKNGSIVNCWYGFRANTVGYEFRLIDLRITSSGAYGIYAKGSNHIAIRCIIADSGTYGIHMPDTGGHIVDSCIVYSSINGGIVVGNGSILRNNTAYNNNEYGIKGTASTIVYNTVYYQTKSGIIAMGESLVMFNTSYDNNQENTSSYAGIEVDGDNCLVKNNTVTNNNQDNIIITGSYNSIEENLVTGSTDGIDLGAAGGNLYINNRAANNTNDYSNTAGDTDGGGNISF